MELTTANRFLSDRCIGIALIPIFSFAIVASAEAQPAPKGASSPAAVEGRVIGPIEAVVHAMTLKQKNFMGAIQKTAFPVTLYKSDAITRDGSTKVDIDLIDERGNYRWEELQTHWDADGNLLGARLKWAVGDRSDVVFETLRKKYGGSTRSVREMGGDWPGARGDELVAVLDQACVTFRTGLGKVQLVPRGQGPCPKTAASPGAANAPTAGVGPVPGWGATLPRKEKPARCADRKLSLRGPDGVMYTASMAFKCLGSDSEPAMEGVVWITRDSDGQVVFSESFLSDMAPPKADAADADGDGLPDFVFSSLSGGMQASTSGIGVVLMGTGREASYSETETASAGTKGTFAGVAKSPKEKVLRAFLKNHL